jgi:LCP family protein required for cell wall assembly
MDRSAQDRRMTSLQQRIQMCEACGAQNVQDDRFCALCGILLRPAANGDPGPDQAQRLLERRRVGGNGWQPEPQNGATEPETIEWTAGAGSSLKRKRRRARRRSLLLTVLVPLSFALAIVLAGFAGRGLSETGSTIDKLHQVSTPPAQITDQTVQSSNVGNVTPDQSDEVASLTEPAEDPSKTGSQTQTGQDDDLEAGDSNGESSQSDAAVIPAPENPGTDLPELPVDSTVTEDESEDAPLQQPPTSSEAHQETSPVESEPQEQVPDGEALAEQLMAEGKTFDTAPAQQALLQAQQSETTGDSGDAPTTTERDESDEEDEGGIFGAIRESGNELRDTAEGVAIAAGIAEPDSQPLTIMVMGVDAREGSAIDIGVRPDALMVLRLDPEAGTCNGLAIPRDSLAELPGYGETKINHALMLGGVPYQQLVVENYLGIEIDHYALIDFAGFAELVDAVGGVTIDVPAELASPAVSAGVVTINGEQALQHARYRGSGEGDFDRIRRQQQIMRGLIDAAAGRDLLSEANRLLSSLSDHIRTDMEIDQLVSLARLYQERCTATGLNMSQIPGAVVYGPIIDPLFNLPLSYVVSDPEIIRKEVARMLDE